MLTHVDVSQLLALFLHCVQAEPRNLFRSVQVFFSALRNCSKSIADSLVMSESAADEKYSILKLIYVQIKTFPKQESALIIAKSSSSMCISVAWKLCQHSFKDNAQN